MIFDCLIHNFPKLTTLPTVQGATSTGDDLTGASSSNRARTSKSPSVPAPAAKGGQAPATTLSAPARAAKGGKAPATTPTAPSPAAKGGKATGGKATGPKTAPAAPDSTKCCFFNTFKSQWQPHLPLLVCDADATGLRPCKSGKIPNMIQII